MTEYVAILDASFGGINIFAIVFFDLIIIL